jgi:hypothetical protein
VLIGGVIGQLVAQNIYRRRHEPEVGGGSWESLRDVFGGEGSHSSGNMGSPYVPLDSLIYPALQRLVALGLIDTGIAGLRPWTRLECARLVNEAADRLIHEDGSSEAKRILDSVSREFAGESQMLDGGRNNHAQLESIYTRFTGVAGEPLTDNYHFGQTIVNDYGRPFGAGFNSVAGVSGWTSAGPFVVYVRGEYEHAPSAPPLSQGVRAFVSAADGFPSVGPATPFPATDRFRLLDSYVGMNLENWQITFGKQSLWWGPSEGGPFLFTTNTEPIPMFRVSRVTPFRLPWIFGYLGNVRVEAFTGQLSGHEFINFSTGTLGQFGRMLNPQPFLNGQKVSLKITPNFEFSISKTTVFGGAGIPFTLRKFLQSIFSAGNGPAGSASKPGDRRDAVDFSYRIPKLRDWLTFYGDSFVEDEILPLNFPRKAVYQGGLYVSKLPGIPKLDLRLEGGFTTPPDFSECNGCFYQEEQYANSYTNTAELIGTWLGRAAQGEKIWSNYWFSPLNKIGIQLSHRKIDAQFLPQGGTQNDVGVNAQLYLRSNFSFSAMVQYETWQIPFLATGPESNVTTSLQITFWPRAISQRAEHSEARKMQIKAPSQ